MIAAPAPFPLTSRQRLRLAQRLAAGDSVEEAAGLADHLMAVSLRGGAAGSAADRDLDGGMTFFDFLGDLVEGDPSVTIAAVVREIAAHELPTGARDRRGAEREAVVILSAHAALGREWEAVAVAGVQEEDSAFRREGGRWYYVDGR